MVSPGRRRMMKNPFGTVKNGKPSRATAEKPKATTVARVFGVTREIFFLPRNGEEGKKVVITRFPFNKRNKKNKVIGKAVRQ